MNISMPVTEFQSFHPGRNNLISPPPLHKDPPAEMAYGGELRRLSKIPIFVFKKGIQGAYI